MEQSEHLQLRRLTSALLDDVLVPEDRDRLVLLLKEYKQARRVYLRNLAMESALQWDAAPAREAIVAKQLETYSSKEKIVPWNSAVINSPWKVARNWLVGTVAAALAVGLWVTSSWNRSPAEKPPVPTVAQDLKPMKTETQEIGGQTVASVYFQFNAEEDAPEG